MSKNIKKSLDLHGVKHQEAEAIIEDFILLTTPPFKIITGNSSIMKEIVKNLLEKHNFEYKDGDFYNQGYILIF